jgi:hypothetical protein
MAARQKTKIDYCLNLEKCQFIRSNPAIFPRDAHAAAHNP